MPLRIFRKLGQGTYVGKSPRRKVTVTGRRGRSVALDIDGQEVEMSPHQSLNIEGVNMCFIGHAGDKEELSFEGPPSVPVLREELAT